MRVLVTNDDGIDSPGLRALAEVVRGGGHEVIVAAPSWDSSGSSSSVTGVRSFGELEWAPIPWAGWPVGAVVSVDGTPALIALVALHEKFGARPDLVVSGINRGANTGRAILHSGTVGAAFTALQYGCPALAVSLDVPDPAPDLIHWETSATVAARVLDWYVADPRNTVINCNVPNVAVDRLAGIRRGTLDLGGTFRTSVTDEAGGTVPLAVVERSADGPDTDSALLERHFAAVTALQAVVEDAGVDFTALLG